MLRSKPSLFGFDETGIELVEGTQSADLRGLYEILKRNVSCLCAVRDLLKPSLMRR
jgi:hypothetical protein